MNGENYFKKLCLEKINLFSGSSNTIKIKKGTVLHTTNEKLEHVSFIKKGKLKVVKYRLDGNEQVIKYLGEHDSFGEGLIFAGTNYPAYIIAEEDSEIAEVSYIDILDIFHDDKEFLVLYLKEISLKLMNFSDIIEILMINSIKARLVKYFILSGRQQNSDIIYFKSKQEIASNIGSVREVVSKKMKELEDEKIIEIIGKHQLKLL